ncbi:MAG: phosphoribosylglycinamide formyltransferase [Actinomycetes bacterium]
MRLVVLVSGSGTLLASLIDATSNPEHPVDIVAVGADRSAIEGLARAERAGISTFTVAPADFADRNAWGAELREVVASFEPDWILSAGFMRILPAEFLSAFPNRVLNTHPALLPAFPGAHGVRDALVYGAKVTGTTVHLVDEGVDTGPLVAQRAVEVEDGDTEESLHERIKVAERSLVVDVMTGIAVQGCTINGRRVTIP